MKKSTKFILGAIFGVLAILWTILVKIVDVEPIGVNDTNIGFAKLNKAVFDFFGTDLTLYKITDILGYVAILICVIFAIVGVVQLIKKGINGMDVEILALGGLYIAAIILYVVFGKIITINYRPIILPSEGTIESSYPSSHTILTIVVMLSTIIIIDRYLDSDVLCTIIRVVCLVIMFVTIFGRLMSGCHWFTDIIGGVLFSSALILTFDGFVTVQEDVMEEYYNSLE